ncbi:MAG TPA: enoyl-CoA hydratase-related protein [Dehalococcoidia bacterium]|nr:enoyl-CoA hydratase-related protein [Dehalococcoidia bacterium]
MPGPKVLTERQGRIWVVTINRPEVRNCVDGETAQLLYEAVEQFRNDPDLDVLVLTGAGDESFCAGFDLKYAHDSEVQIARRPGADRHGPMGFTRVTDVHKPTIAAINGYCVAGGLELACWCDFRICDEAAQFGVLNRRWGVPLVDGGTQRLPRIVGLGNALYLIETGALIDARQALRMGLVQEVVPKGQAMQRALAVAQHMTTYPQTSLRTDRLAALWGLALPLPDGLALEAHLHRESLRAAEMREGLRDYVEGRRPPPLRPPPLPWEREGSD